VIAAAGALDDGIMLDAASRRKLELECSLSGGTEHTPLQVLYRTATAMGDTACETLAQSVAT
jgi:DNA mismatch repair ATPase MutS